MKKCSKCGVEKDEGEFHKCKSRKDGLSAYCKLCKRENYKLDCEKILKSRKEYYNAKKNGTFIPKNKNRKKSKEPINVDIIQERIDKIHDGKIKIIKETYVNVSIKCKFIDVDFGEFEYCPGHILNGCFGHPKRKQLEKEKTFLKNYGCENPLQNKKIQSKIKKTNLKKYGYENPAQNKEIQEKIKQTNLEKYGCENPQQNKEISLKTAKSSNNSYILNHWKTNEELVCIGSYEKKTVEYLNKNKIDFKWQPEIFNLLNGKTYRPDFYLIRENKWIEIKGYFYDDAKEKWNMFQSIKPNSELWNEKKLKEMGIL